MLKQKINKKLQPVHIELIKDLQYLLIILYGDIEFEEGDGGTYFQGGYGVEW